MKTVIEMALETGWKSYAGPVNAVYSFNESDLIKFAELVRAEAVAKERNSWPAEMEAMERQVNILTDALAQARAEEREACAKVCESANPNKDYGVLIGAKLSGYIFGCDDCAEAIRARGQA